MNDRHGDEIRNLTLVGPRGRRLNVKLDVDVSLYALAPIFMRVSDWKILGAKYGAFVAPSFADTGIAAALAVESRRGINVETGQFNVGDLYVQPVWLGWALPHFDFAFGMGFYAPVGKYDVEQVTLPRLGTIKSEAADNIGYGFWTHRNPSVHDQVHAVGAQVGLTYVPWATVLNFHWFYEYAATDRFAGEVLGLGLGKKF